MSDDRPFTEWLAEVIYDAWCMGLEDSRSSVAHKTPWARLAPIHRQRFYDMAAATPLSGSQVEGAGASTRKDEERVGATGTPPADVDAAPPLPGRTGEPS